MPKLTVSSLLSQLRADLRGDTERGKLVRSAGMIAGMKIGATLLAFGASLLYARALGPHDYGLYAYVIAWTAILTIPAGLGLPQYLVREGAKASESLNWLRGWADKRILVAGSLAGIILACAVFIPAAAGARWLFVIAAPLPLLNNIAAVRKSLLQAHGWIARSQWPQLLFGPAVMLAALGGLWLWRGKLNPIELIAAMICVASLALLINIFQFRRATHESRGSEAVSVQVRRALPFMWLSGLYLLNSRTDLIMLGSLRGAHEAGIYAVASRAAELVPFLAGAVNSALAPRIAHLYYSGEHYSLQRLLSGAAQRYLIATIPIVILIIAATGPLIRHLYGATYLDAVGALRILAVSQFAFLIFGSVGTTLMMTGNEKYCAVGIGFALLINIILNALLIPHYGADGAATATGISIVLGQTLLWFWVRRRLNLRPSGLGI